MKYAIAVTLWMVLMGAARPVLAEEAEWSKTVDGLRARLVVVAPDEEHAPFCGVFIEFENVDKVAEPKKVEFGWRNLMLQVTDKAGKELSTPRNTEYDGMLRAGGAVAVENKKTLRLQINANGLGYNPKTDKVIVDVGSERCWVVPQDGSVYYLSGSFTAEKAKKGSRPGDWSGTIALPKVEIPKAK